MPGYNAGVGETSELLTKTNRPLHNLNFAIGLMEKLINKKSSSGLPRKERRKVLGEWRPVRSYSMGDL